MRRVTLFYTFINFSNVLLSRRQLAKLLTSTSALNLLFWLKYMKKMQPHRHLVEKRGPPGAGCPRDPPFTLCTAFI